MKTSFFLVAAAAAALFDVAFAGPYKTHLNRNRDLFPRATGDSCKAPEGKGTCQPTSKCKGISYPDNFCPHDPVNVQCCVEIACSVPAGKGYCRSVSDNGCPGGSFHAGTSAPWPCPGGSDIQCCVKKSGAPSTPPTPGKGNGGGVVPQKAFDLLKELEGFRANYYYDSVGKKTIGYGHNCDANPGPCKGLKTPISVKKGEEMFKADLKAYEKCTCALPNAKDLNTNQFGALVSFAYNSGCGGVANHWKAAMKKKNFSGICAALPTTNTLNGLLKGRRTKESKLCNTPTNVMSGC